MFIWQTILNINDFTFPLSFIKVIMQKLKSVEHDFLTESVLKVLDQSRITTLLDFLQEDTEKISTITRLSISQVLTLRNHIYSNYSAPLITGTTLLQRCLLKKKNFIETGLPSLDTVLKGGIPMGCISEIYGLADSGKTQLSLQVAINCVRNTNTSVLYIDTKGDFAAIRIQKILDAQGLSHKEMAVIMHKIKVVYVWTMDQIIELFQNIKNKIVDFTDLSIIIVDSLPCLMFQFLGDNNKIGLAFLNKFVNYCRFLCSDRNICIICINIQTRWVDQDFSDLEDDREVPVTISKEMVFVEKQNRCLGNYWRHVPTLLLLLEKSPCDGSNDNHNICITSMNCLNRENKKCYLKLNTLGITSLYVSE